MEAEFYSIKEVAAIFACHEMTIRRAIKKGHLVAIRLGNNKKSPYRISKLQIEQIHLKSSSLLFSYHDAKRALGEIP